MLKDVSKRFFDIFLTFIFTPAPPKTSSTSNDYGIFPMEQTKRFVLEEGVEFVDCHARS